MDSESFNHELLTYIGRHGIVTTDHVISALGLSRATAFRHIGACVEGRLLERFSLRDHKVVLLRATRRGLRYAGLSNLRSAVVSLASVEHRLRCASTAQLLADEFGSAAVLTERELRLRERIESRPIASARLANDRLHRPNLLVLSEDRTIAIEVELAPKGPKRLEPIIEAWKQASRVAEVRYYVQGGTAHRGVERAISKLGASDRIHLYKAPPARMSAIHSLPTPAPQPR